MTLDPLLPCISQSQIKASHWLIVKRVASDWSLTILESQTEAREKEEGRNLQGSINVHITVGHVCQVVMHLKPTVVCGVC